MPRSIQSSLLFASARLTIRHSVRRAFTSSPDQNSVGSSSLKAMTSSKHIIVKRIACGCSVQSQWRVAKRCGRLEVTKPDKKEGMRLAFLRAW
jgi:hypothetical protein